MENKSLKTFSELVSFSDPIPGGGGVSSYVGALASSLGMMVCNLTIGKKAYIQYSDELEDIKNKLDDLRIKLLNSINEDADAFLPLAKAYSMDKSTKDYETNLENCLKVAADSPMNILKNCCEVIKLNKRLAIIGSKISVSDAATSVMLAHGAIYGAYINIIVNTRLMKDKKYAENMNIEAKKLLDEYSSLALKVYDDIYKRLSND